ncbi:hypothetical protein A2763_01245 [Candidatus Kaiserbacteria bacterium RIFCSPHIGHO2_01_FULL_54_36]|uniref:HD/PDEase domain-containing protein n=1 Tax=Candidatus Kaiserbacteria bacterium RIFCSPHIGHO2_01_FULL_54_36 TaxID=1798482 RepID=A0A1F6CLZ7_9BACT|nr:MAG: hypothetical protein A2763_01245 [Candidatus Kaiserbacteria bacterium RIFCSPHIGHO2_01_FULL_54_36]OGG75745.1 MAG: hypothetical protein A3A41_00015 [Candidatus Kaiserbacteria bacterium RIFCSPLOWO2_01_FULL_54_22]
MKTVNYNVVLAAEEFATKAHAGQFLRNVSKDPFISHPRRVVELVEQSGGTAQEIAAAWLHDVVEDTDVTLEQIGKRFGKEIAEIVDGLTDPPHFAGHPNKIRKSWQAERVVSKSRSVKLVKIADQTANTYMMGFDPPVDYSPDKSLEYIEGARLIVKSCADVSDVLDKIFEDTYQKAVRAVSDRKINSRQS